MQNDRQDFIPLYNLEKLDEGGNLFRKALLELPR